MSYRMKLALGAAAVVVGLALCASPAQAQRVPLAPLLQKQQAPWRRAQPQALDLQRYQQQLEDQRRQRELEDQRYHDELEHRQFHREQELQDQRYHDELEHRQFHREQSYRDYQLAPSYPQGVPPYSQGR